MTQQCRDELIREARVALECYQKTGLQGYWLKAFDRLRCLNIDITNRPVRQVLLELATL